jgi:hypothetical protein
MRDSWQLLVLLAPLKLSEPLVLTDCWKQLIKFVKQGQSVQLAQDGLAQSLLLDSVGTVGTVGRVGIVGTGNCRSGWDCWHS